MKQIKADEQKPGKRIASNRLIGAGYSMIAGILVLGGAGFLYDRHLGTDSRWVVVGCIAGIAWGFYETVKTALLIQKEEERK